MKTNLFTKLFAIIMVCASFTTISKAQEAQVNPIDTLTSAVEKLQSDVAIWNRLKFSGFVQAQWQKADTIGSPSVAGGNFTDLDNRFQVRRARFKSVYTGDNSQVVLQFDLKENGVFVKEAYGIYTEPWLKTFSLTGGFFNRPIGWEVEASSAGLESPERSRISQTLFPDEVDLGAKLTIQAPKTSALNFIKLDLGLFDGNAINSETDKYKDFIGHLSMKKTLLNENLNVSGGISYYKGGWSNKTSSVYNIESDKYVKDVNYTKGNIIKREYFGIDAQASLNSALGITTIRGEYLWGQQPGTKGSSVSLKGAVNNSSTEVIVLDTISKKYVQVSTSSNVPADVYIRNFTGGYVYFIHRIMQTKHELVVKYDWYDPNTKLSGDKLINAGDVKFTTIGLGWNYYATSNVKITAYYDIVNNETTKNYAGLLSKDSKGSVYNNSTDNYSKKLKDNVLTLRVLYKF